MLNESFLTALVFLHFNIEQHIQLETYALTHVIDKILSQQDKKNTSIYNFLFLKDDFD